MKRIYNLIIALFSGSSLFKPAARMSTEAIAPRTILYAVDLHYVATIYDAILEFNVPILLVLYGVRQECL